MNKNELAKQYTENKLSKNFLNTYKNYSLETQKTMPIFEAYDLEEAYCEGFDKASSTLNLWRDAQSEDLPEIDREVIVLVDHLAQKNINGSGLHSMRVSFAHRPDPKGWYGKDIDTGDITHYQPQTYDAGGWSQPNVKYWLDVKLPTKTEA